MESTAPILTYDAPRDQAAPRGRRRMFRLLLSLPCLVIPFVPFACDVSPAGALVTGPSALLHEGIDREGVCVCIMAAVMAVGLLAVLWRVRVMASVTHPVERRIVRWIGALAGLSLLTVLVLLAPDISDKRDVIALSCLGTTLIGLTAALWFFRRRLRPDDLALAALLVPYVANGVFCLIEFSGGDARIGWYLALFAVPASAAELALLARDGTHLAGSLASRV